MSVSYEKLKAKEDRTYACCEQDFLLRIHRSISWIGKAQGIEDDDDMQFICFWIAFNAAYGRQKDMDEQDGKELRKVAEFFDKISDLDTSHRLYHAVWDNFPDKVRNFISNKFVYQPFWMHHSGQMPREEMEERFAEANAGFFRAFTKREAGVVLSILFSRLYVLRNQLVHGSATYKSSKNRDQVSLGNALVKEFVPICVDVMLDHPAEKWGNPMYPVVEN